MARRPTGRPARHVARGVESELSRNPTLYVGPGAAVGSGLRPGAGSSDAQTSGCCVGAKGGAALLIPWNRVGLESRIGVLQLIFFQREDSEFLLKSLFVKAKKIQRSVK